jgi:hypothetical protein
VVELYCKVTVGYNPRCARAALRAHHDAGSIHFFLTVVLNEGPGVLAHIQHDIGERPCPYT